MSKPRKARARAAATQPPAAVAPQRSSIGDYIRRQRELANVSLRKMSEQSGISAAVLKEIEGGLRNPSKALVGSLAAALRLSAETLYLQAGVLDPKSINEAPLIREIHRDPYLTPRQREIIADVYAAFRNVNRKKPD